MADETSPEKKPKSIGQVLKQARKEQKLTLDQIAEELCISKRHLKNLEEDNENIVSDVYTIGFLKAYAQFLGLNQAELVQQLKEKANQPPCYADAIHPTPPMPSKGLPAFPILGLSVCALVGVFVGLKWYNKIHSAPSKPETSNYMDVKVASQNPKSPEIIKSEPKRESETILAHAIQEQALESQNPSPMPIHASVEEKINPLEEKIAADISSVPEKIENSNPEVVLKITEETWIHVNNPKGQAVVSRVFKSGDKIKFTNPEGFIMKTGNARGTHLEYGEQRYDFPQNATSVQANIPLDPKKWNDLNQVIH